MCVADGSKEKIETGYLTATHFSTKIAEEGHLVRVPVVIVNAIAREKINNPSFSNICTRSQGSNFARLGNSDTPKGKRDVVWAEKR